MSYELNFTRAYEQRSQRDQFWGKEEPKGEVIDLLRAMAVRAMKESRLNNDDLSQDLKSYALERTIRIAKLIQSGERAMPEECSSIRDYVNEKITAELDRVIRGAQRARLQDPTK